MGVILPNPGLSGGGQVGSRGGARRSLRACPDRCAAEAACFNRALQECNAEASHFAFFDDSLTNVTAARSLRMKAFHVKGLQEVRCALAAEGWL